MSEHYIEFNNVTKIYGSGTAQINALSDVSFTIDKGEFCVLLGSSGAGKTTLLNMLGGMDTITSGTIVFDGKDVSKLTKKELPWGTLTGIRPTKIARTMLMDGASDEECIDYMENQML